MLKLNELNKIVINELNVSWRLLNKLNVLITKIQNPYLLTYLLESVDSISSNKVENIHTTLDIASQDIIVKNNISPYVRYREALKLAHSRLLISQIILKRDIEDINNHIMGKNIGFRKTPNTIKNSNNEIILEGAPANKIPDLMIDLIKDINKEDHQYPIISALLIHHKFEHIHPFIDGNGRTGRILFALLLTKYKIMEVPASIFSYSVSRNKDKYYQALKFADDKKYNDYLKIMIDILNESIKVSILFIEELNKKYFQAKLQLESFEKIELNKNFWIIFPLCFFGLKFSMKYLIRKSKLNHKTIIKNLKILEDLKIIQKENMGKYRPYKNLIIENLLNKYFKMN